MLLERNNVVYYKKSQAYFKKTWQKEKPTTMDVVQDNSIYIDMCKYKYLNAVKGVKKLLIKQSWRKSSKVGKYK